jgi:Ni,Fe-hydrogenase III small subunit
MLNQLKILLRQGRQTIPDLSAVCLPPAFRGRPVITGGCPNPEDIVAACPAGAVAASPLRIDLARCAFCGWCAHAFPEYIRFTNDFRMAVNSRSQLTITEGRDQPLRINRQNLRQDIRRIFKKSLKLRQVSAGGDNSAEMELNACSNVNFDMGRFGIEFVASPRHADGIVVTGPITRNMAAALQICYDATPEPKIIVLAGTDAISGGMFAESEAIDRSFLDRHTVDLYIPGNPPHPLTVINGLLDLFRQPPVE